jgi:hypothetical protein
MRTVPGSPIWILFSLAVSVLTVWATFNNVGWSAFVNLWLLLVSLLVPAPILNPDVYFVCLMFTTLSTPPLWVLCNVVFILFYTLKALD